MVEQRNVQVRRANGPEDMAECLRIRRQVFIDEQGVPEAEDIDGLDPVCRHFLALTEEAGQPVHPIGTARLLFPDAGTAKVQRVAVLQDMRGCGVGAALMSALEDEAVRAGCTEIVLAAQLSAAPFYLRLGYAAYGDVFLDAGIEHRMMRKKFGQ